MFRFRRLSHLTLLSLLALLIVPFHCYGQNRSSRSPLTWEPVKLVNGSPVLFRLRAPAKLSEVKGDFLGQNVEFRFSSACRCWYALAGVGLNTKPGKYSLHIVAGETSQSYTVPVSAAHYPLSTIKVAPAFVEPPKEVEPQIQAADVAKKQAFSTSEPEPLWSGRFLPPTATETSGVFGRARVYNGVKKSQHLGLDFRASIGTPVHATNAGTVILARPLYFEGNCVMLDHGQGLVTVYMHLSEFKVKEGEKVSAGQLIALSGGTGRSTGPHLHFAVRWRGEYLNPAILLELRPPEK